MTRRHFKPGDRVYRFVVIDNLGDEGSEALTVVEDHGQTVTVRADDGHKFSIEKAALHTVGPIG